MSERKLLVDIGVGRYPEQLHQEDLLPHSPNIVLALSSSSANTSDYRFALGSMSPFCYDSRNGVLIATGHVCAQAGDFPQLKHKTFADGLQALVNNLVARNPGLVVDFAPALETAIIGYKALEDCALSIPRPILNDEEREANLEILSNAGDYNLTSRPPPVIPQEFIDGFNQQTLYSLIQRGIHSWRLLREFGAVFSQEGYRLKDHLKE